MARAEAPIPQRRQIPGKAESLCGRGRGADSDLPCTAKVSVRAIHCPRGGQVYCRNVFCRRRDRVELEAGERRRCRDLDGFGFYNVLDLEQAFWFLCGVAEDACRDRS